MTNQSSSPQWLVSSTRAARAVMLADMIIEGEIKPPNVAKPWLLPVPPTGQIFTDGFSGYLAARKQPMKARDSLPVLRQALYDLVESEIATNSVEAEGRLWAELSARRLADELGRSPRRVQGLYRDNPFRHVVKQIDGKKRTLRPRPQDRRPPCRGRRSARAGHPPAPTRRWSFCASS